MDGRGHHYLVTERGKGVAGPNLHTPRLWIAVFPGQSEREGKAARDSPAMDEAVVPPRSPGDPLLQRFQVGRTDELSREPAWPLGCPTSAQLLEASPRASAAATASAIFVEPGLAQSQADCL